jgi:putative ABC transport system substrate-binding protein
MNTRRKLVIALGASALAVPFAAFAQSAKMPRIGFLDPGAQNSGLYGPFLAGLKEFGYVDGKNITIEARFANGALERLPALAKELADLKPDILLAQSTPGVRAAIATNTTAPIVMVAVGDPIGSGFVKTLSRPGGNVTGMSILTSDVSPKLLEMLKAAIPKLSRVAVLVNPANPNSTVSLKNIQTAAQLMGLKISPTEAPAVGDIDNAFAAIARQRPDALIVPGDPLFRLNARQVAALAMRYKVPLASTNIEITEAGGLLSYGASIADSYRRAATFVDKILRGAKPADLPVEQSSKFELLINGKTAKALGIKIPQSLLITAEKVIE